LFIKTTDFLEDHRVKKEAKDPLAMLRTVIPISKNSIVPLSLCGAPKEKVKFSIIFIDKNLRDSRLKGFFVIG
jgi:hypothetical protein